MIDYEAWKSEVLATIEDSAHTTEKGDRFVQRILGDRYQLAEDDAINATASAMGGDRGVDAIHIEPEEEGAPPRALIIQGKYGSAGENFSLYEEFTKFANALHEAVEDRAPTDALQQCASILRSNGSVQYIIATVEPLGSTLQRQLADVHVLANRRFQDQVTVEAVSLLDVYQEITGSKNGTTAVDLACNGVIASPDIFVGVAALSDIYRMLNQYSKDHHGVVDSIYDRNVRKWLGKRAGSVNAGIMHTLREEPAKFVAYNNGITIVCRSFSQTKDGVRLASPQIVNGCQTTRTLYDFMKNHFAGVADSLHVREDAKPYREARLPFKLIAVADLDGDLVKNITRFSNKQNAVRGRDFLTLEEGFLHLKRELQGRGYYLSR